MKTSFPPGDLFGSVHRRRSGFSLLEMLCVVAIMSILSTVMVMSFRSVDAAKLTTAGNTMADALSWARQNSIARNAFTAVVVKTTPSGAYCSYCLLQLQQNSDGSYGGWTALTAWKKLPTGIYFYANTGVTDNFLNGSDTVPVSLPTSFPFQGQQIDLTSSTIFHVYQPDGSLISNQEFRLRLTEGVADSSGNVTVTQVDGTGTPINRYDVLILRDTGQVHIERP
jgi:prepilin-type N-terminal cleavage/methylation domain-containing protein